MKERKEHTTNRGGPQVVGFSALTSARKSPVPMVLPSITMDDAPKFSAKGG